MKRACVVSLVSLLSPAIVRAQAQNTPSQELSPAAPSQAQPVVPAPAPTPPSERQPAPAVVPVATTPPTKVTVTPKTLEEILKERGVITEADYDRIQTPTPITYKLGRGFSFTSQDDKFQLSLGARLQPRYTFTDLDDRKNSPTNPDSSRWEIKRLKLWTGGYAYTKDLTYYVQLDFAQAGKPQLLQYAYANYRLLDEAQIRVGQDKTPFGRQWLVSSGALEFVDRSPVSDAFRPGYDVGASLRGDMVKGLATYVAGIYGGAGQSTVRATENNAFAARLTVNPLGRSPLYSEADLDRTARPLLSLGANVFYDKLRAVRTAATATSAASTALETNALNFTSSSGWLTGSKLTTIFTQSEKIGVTLYGFDAAFKWMGASVTGEYLAGRAKGDVSGKLFRAQGYYFQGGYCIIPGMVEAAFRVSRFDPDLDVGNDLQTEIAGAVSYYFSKHNLKLQADLANLNSQGTNFSTNDQQVRLQATVVF